MTVRVVINQGAVAALISDRNGVVMKDLLRRGRLVESEAKRLCPVDTGRLRSSIGPPLPTSIGNLPAVLVGSVVNYAIYQELGTRFNRAALYLTRALVKAGGR